MKDMLFRFQLAMQRWLSGRNGTDALARCCMWAGIVLLIIEMFADNVLLSVVSLALLLYALFRTLSKNVPVRAAENARFEQAAEKPLSWLRRAKHRRADSSKKYFSCPQCGQELSVPRGKGTLLATCPKCGAKTSVKS